METLTKPRGASGSTAASPRWVMLNRYEDRGSSTADSKTTAAAWTSSGLPFSVSFSIATPPEATRFQHHLLGGEGTTPSSDDDTDTSKDLQLQIVAAHDDSVLIELRVPKSGYGRGVLFEYFLYDAVAGRKPSLCLLPGCYVSNVFERNKDALQVPTHKDEARNLSCFNNTGILRRGVGEVLVAQLEVGYDTAELCVLHPGAQDWVLKKVPIVHHDGGCVPVSDWMEIDGVVSTGSRFMCWVNYLIGFLLFDMVEESKLRYVPLPVSPPERHLYKERPEMHYCRKLAAAGPGAVRFVSVAPRCCCGGPGKTSCERSNFAFNVTTWTLNLKTVEPMVWLQVSVLDCNELWQLHNYGHMPRVAPRYPIVSSDDPDIVCFTVCENHYFINNADKTVWKFKINTRSKELLSVVRSGTDCYNPSDFLPAKLHW